MNASPELGFLRLPSVLQLIPVSRSTWWAGVKSGRFPQAIKLGRRTTAWRAADITALLSRLGAGEELSMNDATPKSTGAAGGGV